MEVDFLFNKYPISLFVSNLNEPGNMKDLQEECEKVKVTVIYTV